MTLPSPAWAAKVHEAHVRLGIVMGDCDACREDQFPEWVKRARERRLPVKDYSGAAR